MASDGPTIADPGPPKDPKDDAAGSGEAKPEAGGWRAVVTAPSPGRGARGPEPGKPQDPVDHSAETLPPDLPQRPGPEAPVDAAPAGPPQTPALEKGTKLGRYLLLDKLGEGGMGVVYAAYDPELDRKVALKILSARVTGTGTQAATASHNRLIREAQAMARVKHPNVITVYDVGTIGAQVFVAMELVDGGTLGRWFRSQKRPWREIVRLFGEAGKGLAAAHAAGLVHRDFKPDNVLLGKGGRVQVTDFGLARLVSAEQREEPSYVPPRAEDSDERGRLLDTQLTQAGAIVGTPAYMAPEQHLGLVPDARTDQFSFCAALYYALFASRPFDPTHLSAHASRVLEETGGGRTRLDRASTKRSTNAFAREILREPPREPHVPKWVKSVVMKGLSIDPNDRFGSMEELLKRLEINPQRQQRRVLAGGAVALFATVGLLAYQAIAQRTALCQGGDRKLQGVWDDAVRTKIDRRLKDIGKPWAIEAAAVVQTQLDKYSASWRGMFKETCEATRVRGEQSEDVMSLRMVCLDNRLKEVRALTQLLSQDDETGLPRSADAVHTLTALSLCADVALLTAPVRPPSDPRLGERIDDLNTRLLKAKALHDAAKYKEGLTIAEEVAPLARGIGYAPLEAHALYWLGWLQDRTGDYKAAEKNLREAWLAAESGRDDERKMRTITRLSWNTGYSQGRFEEGLWWSKAGESVLRRIGGNEDLEFDLRNTTASVLMGQGKFGDALVHYERASGFVDRVLDSQDPRRAVILSNMAMAYRRMGNPAEAVKLCERALATLEAQGRREHQYNAGFHNNLATALIDRGEFGPATQHAREAVQIYERRSVGEDGNNLAAATDTLLTALLETGHYEEALERAQRSLRLREKSGSANAQVGGSYESIGEAYRGLKQYDLAIDALERSLLLREPSGVEPALLANSRFLLAQSLWDAGRDKRRARALATQARDGYGAAGDKQHQAKVAKWLQEHGEEK